MRTLGFSICCSLCLTACPAGDDGPASDTTLGPTSDDTGPLTTGSTTDGMVTSSSSGQDTGTASGTTGGSSAGSETGPVTCDFDATLDMLAQGKTEPVDCGTVTLEDDAAAWEAASTCAAGAAAMQGGFRVAFQLPSIDSTVYEGYFGVVGFTYSLGRVYYDTLAEPVLGVHNCTDVVAMAGCQPDVEVHCLECVGEGEVMPLECVAQ